MSSSGVEVCAKCGREIIRSHIAYVFKGEIVCPECDRKLRNDQKLQAQNLDDSDSDLVKKKPVAASGQIYKCYVCGEKCSWDPVKKANYNPICERCSREMDSKREMKIHEREEMAHNQRIKERTVGLLAGLGLVLLGIIFILAAIWVFLIGKGALVSTAMSGGILAIAVPCFKLGIELLRQ